MMLLETIKTIGEVIGSIMLVGTACWRGFGRKWWNRYRESVHARWDKLARELIAQNEQLAAIKHMLYPNGGTSMFDMQIKTVSQVKDIILKLNGLQVSNRNTWDILDISSWESDSLGRITYVSVAFCELIGALPTEVMGNSWVGRVASWDRDMVVKLWKESVANGSEFTFVHSLRRNDGLYQMVQPIVIHNKDPEGNVLNSLGRLLKIGEPYKRD